MDDLEIERRQCPACGATEADRAFTDINRREGLARKGSFSRCVRCATLYLRAILAPDALSEAYATGQVDPVEFGGEHSVRPVGSEQAPFHSSQRILRAASRWVRGRPHEWPEEPGNGRRILDFGCMSGEKLIPFFQRGWSVAGFDLNRKAIARARALLPEGEWYAGPIDDAPAWAPFDVVRSDNVVEHLPDPLAALKLLRSRLKPGGRLLIYVPSGEGLSIRLLRGRSQSSWMPFHLQLFSRRGLGQLLVRAGFEPPNIHQFTPLSWWELTARQVIAAPGFMNREPSAVERAAMLGAKGLTPIWLLAARLGFGEELIADAHA